MKGTLIKTKEGWAVRWIGDVRSFNKGTDYMITPLEEGTQILNNENDEVEFELCKDVNDQASFFKTARLINTKINSNKNNNMTNVTNNTDGLITITNHNNSFFRSGINLVQTIEKEDSIELIYTEDNPLSLWPESSRKVFKIIYSCVDGKFTKSERIYGKLNPPTYTDETYEFE